MVSERRLQRSPKAIHTTRTRRARIPARGGYACMNARNITGIKLPAAKLIGTERVIWVPACAAATPVAQSAAISVKVVNRRLSCRSGEAFHTRTAKTTSRIGITNDPMCAISSYLGWRRDSVLSASGSVASSARSATPNSTLATVPDRGARAINISRARWKSAISRQIDNPSPVPNGLVVKNG